MVQFPAQPKRCLSCQDLTSHAYLDYFLAMAYHRLENEKEAGEWLKAEEAALNRRYEKELMNPKEGLALGSISSLVMPTDLRKVLGESIRFFLRHYKPSPMSGPQREFH